MNVPVCNPLTVMRKLIHLTTTSIRRSLSPNAAWPCLLLASLLLLQSGCQTPQLPPPTDTVPYSEIRLREGDVIKIAFPGAPTLDSTQQIRRDGKITLTLGGEISVLNKTPSELEKEVLRIYDAQLVVKQVVVTVTSSSFPVFVSGAVLRPGKISADRAITVLEAIMEAGGFDAAKADLKNVRVLRQIDGKTVSYKVNLKDTLGGATTKQFFLKPSDIVYVPEKFNWF